MISVLVPTNRVGGLDVLFSGLAVQSHKDLELVLIDDLHAFRADHVAAYAKSYDLRVTHVPPWQVKQLPCGMYEPGHYQRALNTGLLHAKGDVVIVLCDYTYLHPQTVAAHAEHVLQTRRLGLKSALQGPMQYVDIKPHLHPGMPERWGWYAMGHDPANYSEATYAPWLDPAERIRLGEEWLRVYQLDLQSGAADRFMWSAFEQPITPETDISQFRIWQHGQHNLDEGKQHHQQCNLKNSGFHIDDLLAVNGFDEEFDGCHGHQDSEMAGRLENRLGMEYILYRAASATLFEPHGLAIIRGYTKVENYNLGEYNKKWHSQVWEGGAGFDIAARRKELQCQDQ